MATRHKKIVETLEVGSSTDWNDDHTADYTSKKTHKCFMIGSNLGAHWDFAQTTAAANPSLEFIDHHEIAEIDSLVAGPTITSMRHEFSAAAGNITHINDSPTMITRVWIVAYDAATECAEWGLFESSETPFTANQDGAYFRLDTDALYAVTGSGAAETATDITPALGVPEFAQYVIELTATECKFYIDDRETPVATHLLTLPDSDLTMKYSTQTAGAIQTEIRTDAICLERNVYKG